ncbi:hypothetical protein [Mesorhizobium xinjiangense]|uniref:hypothetical protein n=1 Tax=Mesorhizobium xinjiangense TaxID=2678685 RepID=UPI0012ECC54A|nr:hypothetical protein [Mesorhizobium xinjiangense]
MVERNAVLRIHGHGGEPVDDTVVFLTSLNQAYSGILLYEMELERLASRARYWRRYEPFLHNPTIDFAPISFALPAGARLCLKGVVLQSPGFWDFLGKLNPLEVIRNAINDAHERRKDRAYRESAEERRLTLENKLLENQAIKERIEILQSVGITPDELAQVRTSLIHDNVDRLLQFQNSGMIEHAELDPPRKKI